MSEGQSPPTPDPFEGAWEKVDRAWDDLEAHRKFLALAATLGRLPEAGRRYRAVRDGVPERRAMAERQIERLLGLAMQDLVLTRTVPPKSPRRVLTMLGLGVTALLVCATAWALLRLR